MSNLTTVTFYISQFQPELTYGTNFCQTAEIYLYTWYHFLLAGHKVYFILACGETKVYCATREKKIYFAGVKFDAREKRG